MSYTKNTWETGDVITAEKLNNLETGVANHDVFTVSIVDDDGSYHTDKTVSEIMDAFTAGQKVIYFSKNDDYDHYPFGLYAVLTQIDVSSNDSGEAVNISMEFGHTLLVSSSVDDYLYFAD